MMTGAITDFVRGDGEGEEDVRPAEVVYKSQTLRVQLQIQGDNSREKPKR